MLGVILTCYFCVDSASVQTTADVRTSSDNFGTILGCRELALIAFIRKEDRNSAWSHV